MSNSPPLLFRLRRVLRSGLCLSFFLLPLAGADASDPKSSPATPAVEPPAADPAVVSEDPKMKRGAALFAAQCASCHGASGEGTEHYKSALIGDKAVRELAMVIDSTMPEDDPELCKGEDAEAVAAYIYDAFYSPIAQARLRPATVDFSRLTVRQFENTVADLIGSFGGGPNRTESRGLKAEYYNLRSFNKDKRVIERVDPVVSFEFGSEKPEGFPTEPDTEKRRKDDIHDNLEFSIRWNGSLIVPESGNYELILESENGVRLFLNNNRRALCDAWVSSGSEKDHRARIQLLGGRRYPIRLEFFRYKQKTASIKLKWKRPGHVEELIPTRFLAPEGTPEVFVLETPFPPDDRSVGYERGTSVSKGWQDAVVQASLETADHVVDRLDRYAGVNKDGTDREQKVKIFCERFVERALRRPLSAEESKVFVDAQLAAVTPETGVKRVVLVTLMSPQFLYREHGRNRFDNHAMAAWLSYALWDSLPDQPLRDAAAKGELTTPEQINRQVDRMLNDPRATFKLTNFFRQWLRLDHMPEIHKNPEMYAGFDAHLVSDLRSSLEIFLDEVINSPEADFRRLFLEENVYVNGRVAAFYGVDLPVEASFEKAKLPGAPRTGVLTHPLLLAGFAYDQESSPIHRGVFIARSILGRRLNPPPEAVSPLAPDLHAGLTTRERVLLQTGAGSCQSCHFMINDLGFSLEHFDAAGRYRERDKDQPVNTKGNYLSKTGEEVSFVDSLELSRFLSESGETSEAFTEQLFQYTVKQPIRAFGQDELTELSTEFAKENYNIRRLLKEIVVESALGIRELEHQHQETVATP